MTDTSAMTVTFTGAATIRQAEDMAISLSQSLATADRIQIDCRGVTEADTAFVQLIIAARNSADRAGKSLELISPATGSLLAALTALGIQPGGSQNFWFQGRAQ